MDDHQISQVLVVRNGRLVGIVGRMQLLAALERCLTAKLTEIAPKPLSYGGLTKIKPAALARSSMQPFRRETSP